MSVQFAEGSSGRPSAADLASFANKAKEIDVGGDDIVDLGDDLGMSLLTNQNKVAPSPKGNRVSFGSSSGSPGSSGSGGYEMPNIQIKPVDDLDVVNLDMGPGTTGIRINHESSDNGGDAPFVINTGGSSFSANSSSDSMMSPQTSSGLSPDEEKRQKQAFLTKLQRLEGNGIKGQRMTMMNSYEEIKAEHDKLTDSRNLEASIRFQRNALMTFVTGVEMVNEKFGHRLPMKPRLKGWSESVHTNVEDFDEIFEELYDLYKDQAKMHPMLRLVGTLGVSATMYHLTNTAAERSGIPGMSDVLNENPELQRQFAAAMMAKMGGGLGNFMAAAGGPGLGGGVPAPPQMPMGMPSMESRIPFNMASGAGAGGGPKARREMTGPSHGVDDILRAFEAEREAATSSGNPILGNSAGIFTQSGPPPMTSQGPTILRQGLGTPSDPLSEFMDDQSIESGGTMNTERRRGRPRKAPNPVGATLNINV